MMNGIGMNVVDDFAKIDFSIYKALLHIRDEQASHSAIFFVETLGIAAEGVRKCPRGLLFRVSHVKGFGDIVLVFDSDQQVKVIGHLAERMEMRDRRCEFHDFAHEHGIIVLFTEEIFEAIGMVVQVDDFAGLHVFFDRKFPSSCSHVKVPER